MKKTAIGIDLGCTNIKAVVVDSDGNVVAEERMETREHDDRHWKAAVRELIHELTRKNDTPVHAVGLCAPGLANDDNRAIGTMPGRLPGLENFNWGAFIGRPVLVLNDAHAALTAEAAFGAAKGARHAVLLTLGSGVGGAILIDGKLYQGARQRAGHLGHITVDARSTQADITGMPGSLEDAIGNITIEQRSQGKFKTTFALIDAYRRGDPFATRVWLDAIRDLAVSVAALINVLSPEVVIIGGGISHAGEALFKPLRELLDRFEWRPAGEPTTLRPATYFDLAGAIGAAAFALSQAEET